MSMDLILSKAVEIGELMRETEQVKRLMAANEAFEADLALRDKVGDFEMQRQKLVQMEKDGAKREEMEDQNAKIMSIYEEIMASPVMSDMTDANNEVQEVMNYIIRTISSCFMGVSDGCGGDCSGCSGCH
ncbi:MAG: YlbF family regulator [Clostridia bacterium]|nr:YlbF family regulator [Clostridia bacterium]